MTVYATATRAEITLDDDQKEGGVPMDSLTRSSLHACPPGRHGGPQQDEEQPRNGAGGPRNHHNRPQRFTRDMYAS